MSALDPLTPVQWEALKATADRHLRDVEEMAAEIRPLVYIDPAEVIGRPDDNAQPAVKDDLTPTTELSRADPGTFSITFTTAPTNQEPPS